MGRSASYIAIFGRDFTRVELDAIELEISSANETFSNSIKQFEQVMEQGFGLNLQRVFEDKPEAKANYEKRFGTASRKSLKSLTMDNGWRILNLDGSYLNSDLLQQISEKTKLVICSIEEHCMATEAEAWEDQEKIWSVAHVRDKGKDHLEASGELPPAYAEIASKYLELHKKRPADYLFEIPSEVAQSVTGFKMD